MIELKDYPKAEIADANTLEIKYIITELIERTGIIDHLTVSLPESCLSDVLQTLDKDFTSMFSFKLLKSKNGIHLELFNKRRE